MCAFVSSVCPPIFSKHTDCLHAAILYVGGVGYTKGYTVPVSACIR
jgi:hypothetical protein